MRFAVNDVTAEKAVDGPVTIQFGGCASAIPNCLPIMKGWNCMVRLYRPRSEIPDCSWKFLEAEPAGQQGPKWMSEICIHISDGVRGETAQIKVTTTLVSRGGQQPVANSVPNTQPTRSPSASLVQAGRHGFRRAVKAFGLHERARIPASRIAPLASTSWLSLARHT